MAKGRQERRTPRKKPPAPSLPNTGKLLPNPLPSSPSASTIQGTRTSPDRIQTSSPSSPNISNEKKPLKALLIAFGLTFIGWFVILYVGFNAFRLLKPPIATLFGAYSGLVQWTVGILFAGVTVGTFASKRKMLPSGGKFFMACLSSGLICSLLFLSLFVQWTQPSRPKPIPPIIYEQHSAVTALAWSPDGKRIASASVDGTIQIWVAASGQLLLTYRGHKGRVNAIAWDSLSNEIASGGDDKTVQVWNPDTGILLATYPGHKSAITAVAWNPFPYGEPKWDIASGDESGVVQLWNSQNHEANTTFSAPRGPVDVLAWSPADAIAFPDALELAAEANGDLFVWTDTEEHGLENPIVDYSYPDVIALKFGLAWSPDGKYIASAISSEVSKISVGDMAIWDVKTRQLVHAYHILYCNLGTYPSPISLAWSPDGKRFVSDTERSCPGSVEVWDAATGNHPYFFKGHNAQVNTVAWSPDDKRIASGGVDQTVQVWQAP